MSALENYDKEKVTKVAGIGSTVVEYSTHHSKVKGLSPAALISTHLEKYEKVF